ncbi:MAG: DUF4230 domain-containing protein [Anaerolineae bacterium]|nr:DUF4230 domain-containing protein [Anaerolineae bacterium]
MESDYQALPPPAEPPSQPPPRPGGINTCLMLALAGALVVVLTVAIVVIAGGDRALRAIEMLQGGPRVTTVQVSPGELLPVLKLAVVELHTTVHTSRTGPTVGGLQSVPRHIIAQGSVTACFDLENNATALETVVDPNDPEHITVSLPAPEYCYVGIDSADFFDEMGLGLPAGNEVNARLLEDAKEQLYTAADSQNLMRLAQERGTDQVRLMLLQLGYKRVEIEFREPEHVE